MPTLRPWRNCLIVPGSHRLAFHSNLLVPWKFPEPKGRAWLKHSIEEMGSLENFLPELYARQADEAAARTTEAPLTQARR